MCTENCLQEVVVFMRIMWTENFLQELVVFVRIMCTEIFSKNISCFCENYVHRKEKFLYFLSADSGEHFL